MDKKDEDKITDLKTLPSKQKDEIGVALLNLKRMLPEMLGMQSDIAQVQRARYLALMKEGFDEKQSLELTANMSMFIK